MLARGGGRLTSGVGVSAGEREALTGRARMSAGGGEGGSTLSGFNLGGPWAVSGTGPNGSPAAFYSFSVFFSLFYFSDF
jgi:hypothetical protein